MLFCTAPQRHQDLSGGGYFIVAQRYQVTPKSKVHDHRCPGTHPEVIENAFTSRNEFLRISHDGLTINSKLIHASHNLSWRRGILFCITCGSYTHRRVGNLSRQCIMKVPSSTTRRILNKLIDGTRSPLPGGHWPTEDANPPLHIFSRAGSFLKRLGD